MIWVRVSHFAWLINCNSNYIVKGKRQSDRGKVEEVVRFFSIGCRFVACRHFLNLTVNICNMLYRGVCATW